MAVVPMRKRRYEGGSNAPRTQGWRAPGTDADAANGHPAVLRNRARDLRRNNPWAAKGVSVIVNNTIGYGIRAQWKSKRAQALWNQWAESTDCDARGRHDIYGLQSIAMSSVVESGEVLIRMRPRRESDGLSVPFQLDVIEPDRLVETVDGELRSGGLVSRGIEYDAIGRRVAYYLYQHHPGASVRGIRGDWSRYSRVPANEVIHVYRQDRPEQERGVSWLAPVIMTLRELDIYEDAYLKRQQIANLFAMMVLTDGDPGETEQVYSDLTDGLMPGATYTMRPGQTVEFSEPPKADDYGPFTKQSLYRVAAGLGVTAEALSGDLSQVNFSSGRMGWQEFGRAIDSWRWQMFIPQFCNGVARWFSDVTGINGKPEWTPPARTLIDPTREVPAITDAIRAGLMSLPEAQREQGYDPDRLLEEIAEYNAKLDALGIVLDSDARVYKAMQPKKQEEQEQSND